MNKQEMLKQINETTPLRFKVNKKLVGCGKNQKYIRKTVFLQETKDGRKIKLITSKSATSTKGTVQWGFGGSTAASYSGFEFK